jgi:hypothetical protein
MDGASRLFDLATNTRITYKGLSLANMANGPYLARAVAEIELRGQGFQGTNFGNPVIQAGGIVTNISQDFPPTTQAGGLPTVTLTGNAGSTATVTIVGTDRRGIITITPGGTGIAAGTLATATYSRANVGTNPVPILYRYGPVSEATGATIATPVNSTNFVITTAVAPTGAVTFGYDVGRAGAQMELPRWWRGKGILPVPANDQKADKLAA